MNINKIQRFSEQHKALKDFHQICTHSDVELTIKAVTPCRGHPEATLDSDVSQLIITEVRKSLSRELGKLEETIRTEATKL